MYKIYSLLVLLCAVSITTLAQPTLPPAAKSCNANGCMTNSTIDVCPPLGSTVISAHSGGVYSSGNNSNHLGVGAKWRFRNMASVGGVAVNAEITIDAISNATLENI